MLKEVYSKKEKEEEIEINQGISKKEHWSEQSSES